MSDETKIDEVYGCFDLECPKCKTKVSYVGAMSKIPLCPKCHASTDTKDYNEIRRYALFLGRLDEAKKSGGKITVKSVLADFPEYMNEGGQ